jgi:hypothetical protein
VNSGTLGESRVKRYWTCSLFLAGTLLSGGCGAGPDQPSDGYLEVRAAPDTVVTTGSGLIGGLVDWTIGPDGSLFLLDLQARQVHVTDSTGRLLRTIGRPGQGPGELERPASVHVSGESLTVVDPGNGRLQSFNLDGEPSTSRTIPACAAGPAPPAVGPDGILVRPTLGFDTGLAIVCSSSGEERARLGDLPAPGQSVVDMGQMRAQILEGEVPAIMLNAADAVVGGDGAVWLLLSAAAHVERHDSDGQPVFQHTLDEPDFEAVHAAWMERNAEMEGMAVASLRYILGAQEVGGDLWLLTNSEGQQGARLVVLSKDGHVRERLEFGHVRGAGNFVVDEPRGWVYFYIPDEAMVVRVPFDPLDPLDPLDPRSVQ